MIYYILCWMFKGIYIHFYIIFGTNLLTGGPAQNCCFLPISVFHWKRISNGVQTEWNLRERDFWNKRDPKDLEWTLSNQRWGHEVGGAPTPWARPPPSWGPRCSTDILLAPIYTYVPPNYQIRSQKPNSTAATFCTHEIPSWGLFRSSAGGGIDHGGLLHQHHSLSDDVWVVYLRTSVP